MLQWRAVGPREKVGAHLADLVTQRDNVIERLVAGELAEVLAAQMARVDTVLGQDARGLWVHRLGVTSRADGVAQTLG